MPVPTSIADLSTTAGSNYPAGGDAIGTSLDDYLRAVQAILAEGLKSLYTAGGTANALTVTTTPIFATLSAGMGVWVKPTSDNSGATTLNVNGLGAISVYYNGVACVGGEIKNGVPIYLKYDGTVWNAVTQGTRFTDLAYTGTLTGGTGVINIGSGQICKDALGNVGIGGQNTTGNKLDIKAGSWANNQNIGLTIATPAGTNGWLVGVKLKSDGVGFPRLSFDFPNSNTFGNSEGLIIDTNGNVLVTSPASLGYGSGTGGTATQPTSKTSAVTLNKPSGQITLNNSSLSAGATAFFTINNSLITDKDTPTITRQSGGTNQAYQFGIDSVATGSCVAWVKNITAGALAEAPIVNFHLNRGSTS